MQTFRYVIQDEAGLHVRPAGLLAEFTQNCSSAVTLLYEGKAVDAKRIFAVMSLCVKTKDEVLFQIEGENEVRDREALEAFCREKI